ncbi:unnamed protein product, partial [Amoebophrya sp. A25]
VTSIFVISVVCIPWWSFWGIVCMKRVHQGTPNKMKCSYKERSPARVLLGVSWLSWLAAGLVFLLPSCRGTIVDVGRYRGRQDERGSFLSRILRGLGSPCCPTVVPFLRTPPSRRESRSEPLLENQAHQKFSPVECRSCQHATEEETGTLNQGRQSGNLPIKDEGVTITTNRHPRPRPCSMQEDRGSPEEKAGTRTRHGAKVEAAGGSSTSPSTGRQYDSTTARTPHRIIESSIGIH